MRRVSKSKAALWALMAGLMTPAAVLAQNYPNKAIRMVLGFPPGGGTDAIARLIGPKITEALGQPVVIDNRPGADSNIAFAYVARAQPDGYTLLLGTGTLAINMSTFEKEVQYDAIKDFAPITIIGTSPHVLAVTQSLPANSLKELVDLARAKPGELNYAMVGGAQQLAAELFKLRTKTNIVAVPYNGSAPALTALIRGEVHVSFSNITALLPQVKAGKVRVLGAAGSTRSVLLPDVPTMKEQGINVESAVWYGLLAPAQTPRAIVNRIADVTIKATRSKDISEKLLNGFGAEPVGNSPEAFSEQLRNEVKQWSEVVKLLGLNQK